MAQTVENRKLDPGRIAAAKSARFARRLAFSTWALSIFFAAAALAIMLLGWSAKVPTNEAGPVLNPVLIATVFSTAGAVVASRRPENPVGWIMCATGLLFASNALAGSYAAHALYSKQEPMPGAALAAWANVFTGNINTFPFLMLLFPNGRLPSRRWRLVVWLLVVTTLAELAYWAFAPGWFLGWPSARNPFGVGALGPFLDPYASYAPTPLLILAWLLPAISLVARFWRSRGVERQQLKWIATSGVLVTFATSLLLLGGPRSPEPMLGVLWGFLALSLCTIPVSVGIAILRYRLWAIDLVINRALVYGTLTACVFGVYVLVVGGLGALMQAQDNLLLSVLAAGLVAVLFQPLRYRLQRGVNRLMYGERDEPYAVVSRLGRRLEGTLATEAVLPTVVEDVARALRLPHVAIWFSDGDYLRLGAVHGSPPPHVAVRDAGAVERLQHAPDGLRPEDFGPSSEYGTVLAERGVGLVLPLAHRGELVGAMCLASRGPGEEFSPADRLLLRDLAIQAGAASHAVRLTATLRSSLQDLRRSREKLVAAQEEERRRIQRDLHDGLGPVLASMRLRLEACLDSAQQTEIPFAGDLERLYELVGQATGDIRRLVYDLRPPVLDQLGLVAALRQHCDRFHRETGIRVDFEVEEGLSIPAAAEVTLLRVVQEALLNVQKHARASRVDVRLGQRDGWLALEIRDDGEGFDSNGNVGTGIGSMRERAELLGGTLRLTSEPGSGTQAALRIPVEEAER